MKRSLLTSVFVVCFVITASVAHAKDYYIDFSANNWVNPVWWSIAGMQTNTAFNFMSPTYECCLEKNPLHKQHTGIDIYALLDSSVYAIADGIVSRAEDHQDPDFNLSVVSVRHMTDTGQVFTAVYGHCKGVEGLKKYDMVYAGQVICNVQRYNFPDHLHFEINVAKNFGKGPGNGWGMLDAGADVIADGRRNSETFLADNSPAQSYYVFDNGLYVSDYLFADLLFDDAETYFKDFFSPRQNNQMYDDGSISRSYDNANGQASLASWKGDFWYKDGWIWTNYYSIKQLQERIFPDCGRDPYTKDKDKKDCKR